MSFITSFLLNLSVLITCAYIFNLFYKYLIENKAPRIRQAVIIIIFILSGWISMAVGVKGQGLTLFDLRAVPIIFGTLLFRRPLPLLIIGAGISAARFTFAGVTPGAITGSINIFLLGCMGALLVLWFQGRGYAYKKKAVISVFTIITFQAICIATFGAVPRDYYLTAVAPFSYPAGLLLSLFFVFIISDFYKEQLRSHKLRRMNVILRRQTKELRDAKSALVKQAAQLLMASQYKSEFIANISHELRTPLNSIILLSQMIRENEEGSYKEQEVSYAGIIHTSGQDLLRIINDILDLSKVEAGKLELHIEWAALDDLFEGLMHEFEPLARHKGLEFEFTSNSGVPDGVFTDVLRLRQILRNLLMNAFKFTEKGRVGIEVNAGEDTVIFTVTDTGIGISTDKQQEIFEAFRQEDGAVNRRYGGTGLGLSISLQLAKLLGGTVTVESEKGAGSRFSLMIPVRHPHYRDESASKESTGLKLDIPALHG